MKAAVIYFLVLFIQLFGGYTGSYAAVSGYNEVNYRTSISVHSRHISTTHDVQSPFFKGKNDEQGPADYLIYVEDEDDDRNVSKKTSSLNYNVLTWLFEPVSPFFLRNRLNTDYHLSYSATDKYLTHRALRI